MNRAAFLRLSAAAAASLVIPELGGRKAAASEKMLSRAIPSSGELLPIVGCGTWRSFDVGGKLEDRARLRQVLLALFEAGGSVIDSAPMYGAAEAVVGDLLVDMKARDRAFLATKVWIQGRQAGIDQMRHSLTLLRAPRIELMQVHNLLDWRTHLATLRAWKAEGLIRYLGVTHYTPSAHGELEAAMRAQPLDFVQLNYALDDRDVEKRLLPLAAEGGIAVVVNQPFGGGSLLRRLREQPLPAWAAEIGCTSWAQILSKCLLAHDAVTCVIPGTGQPAHMADNARVGFGILSRCQIAGARDRITVVRKLVREAWFASRKKERGCGRSWRGRPA